MSIDRIIFPRPKPQYNEQSIKNKDDNSSIQFINSPSVKVENENHQVPVMSMVYKLYEESFDIYILFFHGNAEDLGGCLQFLKLLRESLRANIIAVEYPSYGIYDKKVSSEQIKQDALKTYDSLIESGIDQSKIFVFGRSIGSGPACEIGAQRRPGGIILLSAFTSIKKLSGELSISLVSYFVKERFNNIDNVQRFTSPCLLIHGQADSLIKHSHSLLLQDAMRHNGRLVLAVYPERMTHNQFQIRKDIVRPIEMFLKKIQFQYVKIQTKQLPQIFQNSISEMQIQLKNQKSASEDCQKQQTSQQQIEQAQKRKRSDSHNLADLTKSQPAVYSERKTYSSGNQRQNVINNLTKLQEKNKKSNQKQVIDKNNKIQNIEIEKYEVTEKKEERSYASIYRVQQKSKQAQDENVIQPIQPVDINVMYSFQKENNHFAIIKLQTQDDSSSNDNSPDKNHKTFDYKEQTINNQIQKHEYVGDIDEDIQEHQSDFNYDSIENQPQLDSVFSQKNIQSSVDKNIHNQKEQQNHQKEEDQDKELPEREKEIFENYPNNLDYENQLTAINHAQDVQANHKNEIFDRPNMEYNYDYNNIIEQNGHFQNYNNSLFQKIDDLEICN